MSSPFDTFRKNRTYWMAGLVLVAILSFVVAPAIDSLMDTMRSGSNPGNEVVVRWADGRVTSGTVNYIRMQHSRSIRFLQALAREVIANGGMPKVPGFRYDPTNKRVEDLGLPMLDTNRAVCQTMIISERAKQLGIEFDKPVIDDFLQRFCDRKITPERFEAILKEAAGRELSFSDLYRQLGMELSALVMERVALAGVNHEGRPLVTPGSLWQNYLRLNQAARVEAYPILTRDFVKLVKEEPTKAELDALYAAGAGVFPSPNSPEAGFRRRYQASLEYVSGSWNKMLDVEKANISEEALKAEYERQVAAGQLKVPVEPPAPPASSATPATPAPAGTEPAPAGTEPAKVPSAATPDEGQPPSPKTQSRLLGGSKLKFVAFQQTDELPPVVINPPPPVSPPDGAKGATAESTPAMRTQTFEEAKDSLARSLAMGVVRDQLQAKLAKVEAAMTAYASNLAVDQINEQNKVKADKKAVPVDLKKLAEAEGLTYGSTGLSDGFRLASTPIGRSMISNQTLANTVMFPGVELYRPVRSMFIDMGNATEPDFQEFLSWKTEQVDAYLPALNDIRDEVVEAWKNQKARVLAREEAEKLAAKVKQSGEMAWKGALDDQQQALVISPPPFTWMSAPREMFAPAQISFVQGLDTVGQEFMQRVFSSTAGDVVAVPNQGLNTYYIVRVAELTPTVEQLRENFEVSRGRASQLAFPERERMFSDWYEGIERAMNVQWVAGSEDLLN